MLYVRNGANSSKATPIHSTEKQLMTYSGVGSGITHFMESRHNMNLSPKYCISKMHFSHFWEKGKQKNLEKVEKC